MGTRLKVVTEDQAPEAPDIQEAMRTAAAAMNELAEVLFAEGWDRGPRGSRRSFCNAVESCADMLDGRIERRAA